MADVDRPCAFSPRFFHVVKRRHSPKLKALQEQEKNLEDSMKTLEKVVTGEGLKEGQSKGQVRSPWRYIFVDSSRMFQGRSNEVSHG